MEQTSLSGGCHCGNVHLEITLTAATSMQSPRACDCDFCRKHGAAYVSDPQGKLRIDVRNENDFGKYKQGSGISDCLICRNCGVLIGFSYQEDDQLYVVINSKAIDGQLQFGTETPVSPKLLDATKKSERWKQIWFRDVVVNLGTAMKA